MLFIFKIPGRIGYLSYPKTYPYEPVCVFLASHCFWMPFYILACYRQMVLNHCEQACGKSNSLKLYKTCKYSSLKHVNLGLLIIMDWFTDPLMLLFSKLKKWKYVFYSPNLFFIPPILIFILVMDRNIKSNKNSTWYLNTPRTACVKEDFYGTSTIFLSW